MFRTALIALVASFSTLAHAAAPEEAPVGVEAFALAAANQLDLTELDEDAGLDRRAAMAIIAARAGEDQVAGTSDDVRIESVGALLALNGVGPVSVQRLGAYGLLWQGRLGL